MIKGMEKLREKLPGYPRRKLGLIGTLMFFTLVAGFVFQLFLDIAPRLFPDTPILVQLEPAMPIIAGIIIASMSLTLINSLWRNKESMKAKHGDLAYQKMLPRGLAGVFLMMSIIAHAMQSVRSLPPRPPVNDLTTELSSSFFLLIGVPVEIELPVRIGFATILLILGLATMIRAVLTFGIDYASLVYLYFPEESEIQEHAIYSVIRHPMYFGVVLFGAAAFAFRLSVYSSLLFILLYVFIRIQIYAEETELIERFGNGYKEYMSKVPGLHVMPRNFRTYIRFLRGAE